MAHRDGRAERGEVDGRECRRDLVGIDSVDTDAETGKSQRISADSASEVGDVLQSGATEPPRVVGGNGKTRRLLQAGAGEQHP